MASLLNVLVFCGENMGNFLELERLLRTGGGSLWSGGAARKRLIEVEGAACDREGCLEQEELLVRRGKEAVALLWNQQK